MKKLTINDIKMDVIDYLLINGETAGNLHIILDDGNIDNNHIEWCLEQTALELDYLGYKICLKLLKMSKTQRSKIVASCSKWVEDYFIDTTLI